jgi:hypothetical protein
MRNHSRCRPTGTFRKQEKRLYAFRFFHGILNGLANVHATIHRAQYCWVQRTSRRAWADQLGEADQIHQCMFGRAGNIGLSQCRQGEITLNIAERRRDASFGRQLHPSGDPVYAILPLDDAAVAPRDGRNRSALVAARFRGAADPRCSRPTGSGGLGVAYGAIALGYRPIARCVKRREEPNGRSPEP